MEIEEYAIQCHICGCYARVIRYFKSANGRRVRCKYCTNCGDRVIIKSKAVFLK